MSNYNAYLNVYTTNGAYIGNNEGHSWGFLTVEGKDKLYVYRGEDVIRGRIAGVQCLSQDDWNADVTKRRLVLGKHNTRSPFSKDNPWRSLVNLDDTTYNLLTSDMNEENAVEILLAANNIIAQLRRTVDGIDDNNQIYNIKGVTIVDTNQQVRV